MPGIVAAMTPSPLRRATLIGVVVGSCVASVPAFTVLWYILASRAHLVVNPHALTVPWIWLVPPGAVLCAACGHRLRRGWHLRREGLAYLAALHDERALPALMGAVTDPERPTTDQAVAIGTAALLDRLTFRTEDDARSTPLWRVLRHADPDLVVAALGAIGRVGEVDALQYVRELASGSNARRFPALADARVCVAAREVLPILERLAASDTSQRRLLTPAAAPAAEVLLRPAQPAGESDAALLLRAANSEGEGSGE